MGATIPKASVLIRIDKSILSQLKEDAKLESRSLSNYIETLLYRLGYRPYNEETMQACEEARKGGLIEVIDTSSQEAFLASVLGDERE